MPPHPKYKTRIKAKQIKLAIVNENKIQQLGKQSIYHGDLYYLSFKMLKMPVIVDSKEIVSNFN